MVSPRGASASPVEPATEVLGADAAGTLSFLVEQRRAQDRAAALELQAVAHWAELHRVDTRTEVGAVDLEVWHQLEARLADEVEASGAPGTVAPDCSVARAT